MNKKSIWAVAAGVLVIIVVTTLVDIVLHLARVFPPMDQPINDSLALLATSYRIVIMLSQLAKTGVVRPNRIADPEGEAWDAYIWIENADALHAEFRSKGVTITRDICDQPYGCRDFDVEDCNGYRLCFGHDIEG